MIPEDHTHVALPTLPEFNRTQEHEGLCVTVISTEWKTC